MGGPKAAAAAPTLSRQLAAPPAGPVSPAAQQFSRAQHAAAYIQTQPGVASGLPAPHRPGGPATSLTAAVAGPRRPPPPPAGAVPYSQPQQQQPYGWRGGPYVPQQQQPPQQPPQQQQGGGQWPQRYPATSQWSGGPQPAAGPRPAAPPHRIGTAARPVSAAYLRPAFPPDSVEATLPVLARRRRGTRADLGPVDGWRLTMALRSGQLAESRWALDALQILTFDDTAVAWLGLAHMPGLLAGLLQHFRQSLAAVFARRAAGEWFEGAAGPEEVPDLGVCRPVEPAERQTLLSGPDYTHHTRRGLPVELADRDDEILVSNRRRAWEEDATDADGVWDHVLTHVRVESGRVPFQRRMPDGCRVKVEPDSKPEQPEPEPPADSRLAGFSEPGFFLARLRRAAPAAVADGDASASGDAAPAVKREPSPAPGERQSPAWAQQADAAVKLERPASADESPVTANEEPDPGSASPSPPLVNGTSSAAGSPRPRLLVRDPDGTLKRKRPDEEDECYQRDETSLLLMSETQENMAARCLAASTILRNLSFVPGNERELSAEPVLSLLGDLLLLHHRHPARAAPPAHYDRDEATERDEATASGDEWWSDMLPALHENALVTLTNVAGRLRLAALDEWLVRPLLDGLLHWLQCPAAYATDPLPAGGAAASAQRLALEALCRFSVHPENVDLVLATPPLWRLERVCQLAAGWLSAGEDQVRREMALTLLHALAAADERVARLLADQPQLLPALVRFVEAAEQSAMGVASAQGVNALRDNPDLMGTSLDLLGRAANLLLCLARLPASRPALARCEHRLLALVTSQILDQRVAATLSRALYRAAAPDEPGS